jgi:hypothetical protein
VSTELSLNEPTVAVIVVEPAATVVASPELPMVATEVEDELQVTPPLKSELVPSVYVTVATNCWLIPIPSVSPTGVTASEAIVGAVTVRLVDWDTPARFAETVVVPAASEVARPVALTVAVAVDEELQETRVVRSELLPSL